MNESVMKQLAAIQAQYAQIRKGTAWGPVQKLEMGPQPGDVHVNMPLTNVMVVYMQQAKNFIASRVFPNCPVPKQSDRYFTIPKGEWNRDVATVRANGAPAGKAQFIVDSTASYNCDVYAERFPVTDQMLANADTPLNMDTAATQFVSTGLMIRREVLWNTKYFTTGVWASQRTGGAAAGPGVDFIFWSDYGVTTTGSVTAWNSNPIKDIDGWKNDILGLTGYQPNKIVFTNDVYTIVKNHPAIIDRVKYGGIAGNGGYNGTINEDLLAQLFGLDEVLVERAVVNTANMGQTASLALMATNKALLIYAAPAPSIVMPSGGYTFAWTGYLGATAEGSRIKKYRWEEIEGSYVEGTIAIDQKVVASDLGVYAHNVLS